MKQAVLLCTLLMIALPVAAAEQPDGVAVVAADGNALAFDLSARLRATGSGNLFFSPQSISTALAMTYAGARGDTATEMARTLHFSLPQDRLAAAYAQLLAALHGSGAQRPYTLSVANRLWGQRGTAFLEPFLTTMRTGYGAEMGLVDFVNEAEAARGEINGWVRKETADKITDLLPPSAIGPDTRLVLANAIYFRGDWARQFEKSATQDQPFHVTRDRTVTAPLMFGKIPAGYAARADGGLKVLELPYKGDEVSMLVLLPDATDGLPALEAKLTADTYRAWTADLARRDVLVYLPRFSVESRFALAPTLGAMGMPLAFTDKADFSGMNGKRDLFISAVVHKARVDVDERGTEAAAATGVAIRTAAVQQEPPAFRADHPFLFLIRDRETGSLLFLGCLTQPGG